MRKYPFLSKMGLILPLLVLPRVAHQEQIAVALDLHLDLIVDGLINGSLRV